MTNTGRQVSRIVTKGHNTTMNRRRGRQLETNTKFNDYIHPTEPKAHRPIDSKMN